jgi:hypothetical protein
VQADRAEIVTAYYNEIDPYAAHWLRNLIRENRAAGAAAMTGYVAPLLVLQARAEARALLYATCEFDLEAAIQPLLQYALDTGITDEIGVEHAIAVVKAAFAGVAEL